MNIPVVKKGRKQEVPVTVETSSKENKDAISYCALAEDPYSKKNLAEQLALLKPKELRQVVAAAKHLRKFVDLLADKPKDATWDEWDDEQLDVEE